MHSDAQELLERLSQANRDPEEDLDVTFIFSHHDIDHPIIPLAEEVGDLFADKLDVGPNSVVIVYDEHPKVASAEGNDVEGPPQFTLTYLGPLTGDQFAMLHKLAARLAKQHAITYQGVRWWC